MCALASFPSHYVTTHLRVLSSKNLKKYLYLCIFAIDMKTALPSYNFFIGIQHAVFSLLSSFPFHCYPTAVVNRLWIPRNSFVLFFLIIVIFYPSVIWLNKTQFITHSRVFSLWSSIPFRCFPTSFII